jgi:hydroxymethylpyrimidine pyrophosphatase-like HAD family hydrolase
MNQRFAKWSSNLVKESIVDVLAIGAFGDPEEMSSLENAVNLRFPGEFTIHVLKSIGPNASYCEILPSGIDKWVGLSALAKILGISQEETCAVGDELNDLVMVMNAGLGVAVRNARSELKEVADRVVGRNDQDGLVPLLEELTAARSGVLSRSG